MKRTFGRLIETVLFQQLLLFSFLGGLSFPIKGDVIKNPKPTHIEKNFWKMELVLEISEDIDKTLFFARPTSIAASNRGDFYVYDSMLKRIFKFDKQGRFVKFFGRQGQGPGEFHGADSGKRKLYYSDHHNKLFVCDSFNRKIIVFSKDGELEEEIRIAPEVSGKPFFPVVDKSDNFYILSSHDGAIDIYDKKMKLAATLLTKQDYNCFLLHEPIFHIQNKLNPAIWPVVENTFYDILPGGGLFIYLSNPSVVYILKNNKVQAQFSILPKEALDKLITSNKKKETKTKFRSNEYVNTIARSVFLDSDNPQLFYLQAYNTKYFYRFNLDGELVTTFEADKKIWASFEVKKNNLFYGIKPASNYSDAKIRVLRETKE